MHFVTLGDQHKTQEVYAAGKSLRLPLLVTEVNCRGHRKERLGREGGNTTETLEGSEAAFTYAGKKAQ